MRNVFYFSKKVRLFSQNDVLFLFYFLINPAGTTALTFQKEVGERMAAGVSELQRSRLSIMTQYLCDVSSKIYCTRKLCCPKLGR